MFRHLLQGCAVAALLLATETLALAAKKLPYDAFLKDVVDVRISDAGLRFLADLLGDGLLQPTLKKDIVGALEGQSFSVLIPNDLGGGYAEFLVDFGPDSDDPDADGFRFDALTVDLTTVPAATNLVPEVGVLYPSIRLTGWSGSEFEDKLPELWLRVNYPPFVTDVPAVARARLDTTGVLRPYIDDEGTVGFLVEDFDSLIFEFKVDPFGAAATTVQELLGDLVLDAFSKELEDALADVLQQGINDILFDRDQDGAADVLLDLRDIFEGLNGALGTDFGFRLAPKFQTNATSPTTVLLRTDGSMFLETPGDCVGYDIDAGFDFTDFELDGVAGHDPPTIVETPPGGDEQAQFVVTFSDDFLNQVLFNAYRTGFACLFLNPLTPGIPADVADLLTTASLEIFLGDWVTDLFPDAPFGLRVRMLRAPSATIPASGSLQLLAHLPEVQIDLMIYEHERWLRLMGATATLDLGVGIENISLSGDEFLDAIFSFEVSNTVNFLEFAPEHRETLEDLLPTAISLAEGAVADLIGRPGADITACVAGLDVDLFELAPLGIDPSGDFAHYLGLWLSLEGEVDLGLLFECLLGAPLVDNEASTPASAPAAGMLAEAEAQRDKITPVLGSQARSAADLAGEPVSRWRFEPGFDHPGEAPVPAIGFGTRIWVWEDADGVRHRQMLMGGKATPEWRVEATDAGWRVGVATGTPLLPTSADLRLLDGDTVVARVAQGELDLTRDMRGRGLRLIYENAWGQRVEADVDDLVPRGGGCAAGGTGRVDLALILLLVGVFAMVVRRRRTP